MIVYKKLLLIIYLIFISLFSTIIIYLYFSKNIHSYSFSQNIISYKMGFVPNGLLGSIILWLKEVFDLPATSLLSFIYLLLHIANSGLFLILMSSFIRANFLIAIFLIFNPILIMFALYDIGALFRKETFIIFLLLFHFFISNFFINKKISYNVYLKFVILVIIPGIIINCLIYNLQFFLIPVHILIIKNNLMISKKKLFFLYVFFIFLFFLIDYLKIYTGHERLYELTKILIGNDQKILSAPFIWLKNNSFSSILLTINEINNWKNLHKVYLITNYSLILLLLLTPIIFIFFYIKFHNKKEEVYKILISLSPCLTLFILGIDWGRWFHIIFIAGIMYFSQFKFEKIIIPKKYYYISSFLILIYVTSFGVPHCCAKEVYFLGFWRNINFLFNTII